VEVLDERPLEVRLKEADALPALLSLLGDPPLEAVEREIAVVQRVSPAQLVEIDAVHDFDPLLSLFVHARPPLAILARLSEAA
jgi:hypothetical protein